ncbi:UNVERIFIED_CONTAM: hypothetical protein FKN15_011666 [Acipenser sinensis]
MGIDIPSPTGEPSAALGVPLLLLQLSQSPSQIPCTQAPAPTPSSHSPSLQEGRVKRLRQTRDIMDLKAQMAQQPAHVAGCCFPICGMRVDCLCSMDLKEDLTCHEAIRNKDFCDICTAFQPRVHRNRLNRTMGIDEAIRNKDFCDICTAFQPRVHRNRLNRTMGIDIPSPTGEPSAALGVPLLLLQLSQSPSQIPCTQAPAPTPSSHSPSLQEGRVKRLRQTRDIMDLKAQMAQPRVHRNRLNRTMGIDIPSPTGEPSAALGVPLLLLQLSQSPSQIPCTQAPAPTPSSHSPSLQEGRVKRLRQTRDIMDLKAQMAQGPTSDRKGKIVMSELVRHRTSKG